MRRPHTAKPHQWGAHKPPAQAKPYKEGVRTYRPHVAKPRNDAGAQCS